MKCLFLNHEVGGNGEELHTKFGRLPAMLARRGVEVVWRNPVLSGAMVEEKSDFDLLYVDGGAFKPSRAEQYPWAVEEMGFIRRFIELGRPVLGICLGSSLIAKTLGSRIVTRPRGRGEMGFFKITRAEAGRELLPESFYGYLWHQEGFEAPPPGARLLAISDDFNQGFVYRHNVFGLQFNPAATRALVRRWMLIDDPESMRFPGAHPLEEQLAAFEAHDPAILAWFDGFLDHWVSLARA